jgi:CRISPR/Cas system-associated protein Cas7 (RAMP superfamily)
MVIIKFINKVMNMTEHEKNFLKVIDSLNKLKHDFNSGFHSHYFQNDGEVKKEELLSSTEKVFEEIKNILGKY